MKLRHEFVDYVPEHLNEDVLYVSIPFGTVVHLCACGCGEEVVTPLGPAEWKLTYDGRTVSLAPSIGNWDFHCRSHYWVVEGNVRWARGFSKVEVAQVREKARRRRADYYGRGMTKMQGAASGRDSVWSFVGLLGKVLRTLKRAWQRLAK